MLRNDRSIRILLAVAAFLLGANLFVVIHKDRLAPAAGIPDSGAQMQAQIDQLVELNKKVEALQNYIESGKMVVQVKETKTEK